jgi:hypothetical protein
MTLLHDAGIDVAIWTMPVEIPNPIRSKTIRSTRATIAKPSRALRRYWSLSTARSMHSVRDSSAKCSPVHFFWGSFDLCVTRFSGRRAPERPGADRITQEAYSHEVSSVGFWPGSGDIADAAFYAYTAPEACGIARPACAARNGRVQHGSSGSSC